MEQKRSSCCRPQPVTHIPMPEAIEVYKAWRAKNAANLPTGVSLGWRGDEAYAARVVQLNGGCVIVNMATGEALAEVAHETATSLSPVFQAYLCPVLVLLRTFALLCCSR